MLETLEKLLYRLADEKRMRERPGRLSLPGHSLILFFLSSSQSESCLRRPSVNISIYKEPRATSISYVGTVQWVVLSRWGRVPGEREARVRCSGEACARSRRWPQRLHLPGRALLAPRVADMAAVVVACTTIYTYKYVMVIKTNWIVCLVICSYFIGQKY